MPSVEVSSVKGKRPAPPPHTPTPPPPHQTPPPPTPPPPPLSSESVLERVYDRSCVGWLVPPSANGLPPREPTRPPLFLSFSGSPSLPAPQAPVLHASRDASYHPKMLRAVAPSHAFRSESAQDTFSVGSTLFFQPPQERSSIPPSFF